MSSNPTNPTHTIPFSNLELRGYLCDNRVSSMSFILKVLGVQAVPIVEPDSSIVTIFGNHLDDFGPAVDWLLSRGDSEFAYSLASPASVEIEAIYGCLPSGQRAALAMLGHPVIDVIAPNNERYCIPRGRFTHVIKQFRDWPLSFTVGEIRRRVPVIEDSEPALHLPAYYAAAPSKEEADLAALFGFHFVPRGDKHYVAESNDKFWGSAAGKKYFEARDAALKTLGL